MVSYAWPGGLQRNLLLSKGEVSGPAAPGGPDVRQSGGCREAPVSRVAGTRGLAGQECVLAGTVLS